MNIQECFDKNGNFTYKWFDPYRYEEDKEEYVKFYNKLFVDWDDKYCHGSLKDGVKQELKTTIVENNYPPLCDAVRLYYAQEMGENTKGSYPAIYMWR